MYQGFPIFFIPFLRCLFDEGELQIVDAIGTASFVWQGHLQCIQCARKFGIEDGVVRFLDKQLLHPAESRKEIQLRDEKSESFARLQRKEWRSEWDDETEIKPTISELQPLSGKIIAEYGCGTGRYTLELNRQAAAVLAIDFSLASLRMLSKKPKIGEKTGLVHADITTIRLAPETFDRVLSTLQSNLPTQDQRMTAHRLAEGILKSGGRYVFSMHYHGLRDLVLGVPKSGYYPENGIYRYHMRPREAKRETLPYFAHTRFYPFKVSLPGIHSIYLSKVAQKIPLLSEMAQLLLGVAEKPLKAQYS